MQYVDQSASGLRFYLAATDIDVRPMQVIKETSFVWFGHRVEIGILGASHYLKLKGDDLDLTEVFACADIDLQDSYLKSAPFEKLPAQVSVPIDAIRYSFVPRLVSWDEGAEELAELRQAILSNQTRHQSMGLEHEFPSLSDGPAEKPPLTLLHCEAHEVLTFRTAHCYPNEEQIVFTETLLTSNRRR